MNFELIWFSSPHCKEGGDAGADFGGYCGTTLSDVEVTIEGGGDRGGHGGGRVEKGETASDLREEFSSS